MTQNVSSPAGVLVRGDIVRAERVPQAVVRVRHARLDEQPAFQLHVLARREIPARFGRDGEPLPDLPRKPVDVVALLRFELFLRQQNTAVVEIDVLLLEPAAAGKPQPDERLECQAANHGAKLLRRICEVEKVRRLLHGQNADFPGGRVAELHVIDGIAKQNATGDVRGEDRAGVLPVVVESGLGFDLVEVLDPRLDIRGGDLIEPQMTKLRGEQRQLVVFLSERVGAHAPGSDESGRASELGLDGFVDGDGAFLQAALYHPGSPAGDDILPRGAIDGGLERSPVLGLGTAGGAEGAFLAIATDDRGARVALLDRVEELGLGLFNLGADAMVGGGVPDRFAPLDTVRVRTLESWLERPYAAVVGFLRHAREDRSPARSSTASQPAAPSEGGVRPSKVHHFASENPENSGLGVNQRDVVRRQTTLNYFGSSTGRQPDCELWVNQGFNGQEVAA